MGMGHTTVRVVCCNDEYRLHKRIKELIPQSYGAHDILHKGDCSVPWIVQVIYNCHHESRAIAANDFCRIFLPLLVEICRKKSKGHRNMSQNV